MLNPFAVTNHPSWVTEPAAIERWHRIDSQRIRCQYWWATSFALKTIGWVLRIGTVVVAAIAAGRPGFVLADWSADSTIRSWSTAVAVMSGLSAIIPWQRAGRIWGHAEEGLRDAITLYDGDPTFTVMHVIEAAQALAKDIRLFEEKIVIDQRPQANGQTHNHPVKQSGRSNEPLGK